LNVAEMFVRLSPADVFTNLLPASDTIAVVIALWLPVIVEPSSPKLIPFEFEKVIADRFADEVPPLTLMFEMVAAFESIAVVR
jgi:hypothetical protein